MARRAALKEQVGALWRQAVDQLDDVRQVVRKRGFEPDAAWLKAERDRLLALLGEQTYKLANQGLVPLPAFVKRTVDRLNDILATLAPTTSSAHDYTGDHMSDVDDQTTSHLNGAGHNGTNGAPEASANGAKKKAGAKKARAKSTSKKSRATKTN
jgi:hypothetical protein